jgi:hypothetical protein
MFFRRRFSRVTAAIFLVLVLLISCHPNRKYIIPQRKFTKLLVDLYLANAIAEDVSNTHKAYKLDSASLYGSVLKKYDVTKTQFDSTVMYYSRRPVAFQKVYNTVTVRLNYLNSEIAAEQDKILAKIGVVIWQDTTTYRFPPLAGDRIKINVPLTGMGLYTVSANINVYPNDSALNPRMSLYFEQNKDTSAAGRNYFSETMYAGKDGQFKTYTTSKTIQDTAFKRISGFIVNYSNADSVFKRHLVVSGCKVYWKREETK